MKYFTHSTKFFYRFLSFFSLVSMISFRAWCLLRQ